MALCANAPALQEPPCWGKKALVLEECAVSRQRSVDAMYSMQAWLHLLVPGCPGQPAARASLADPREMQALRTSTRSLPAATSPASLARWRPQSRA